MPVSAARAGGRYAVSATRYTSRYLTNIGTTYNMYVHKQQSQGAKGVGDRRNTDIPTRYTPL